MPEQYITYTDPAKAAAAADTLFEALKDVAVELGYTVDAQGIIAKLNGVDVPTSRTELWSGVEQIPDGRYVVPHPNWHPELGKTARVGLVLAQLPVPRIVDQDDGTWFTPIELQ